MLLVYIVLLTYYIGIIEQQSIVVAICDTLVYAERVTFIHVLYVVTFIECKSHEEERLYS